MPHFKTMFVVTLNTFVALTAQINTQDMSFHLPNLPHVSAQKLVNWFVWQCTWGFTP